MNLLPSPTKKCFWYRNNLNKVGGQKTEYKPTGEVFTAGRKTC